MFIFFLIEKFSSSPSGTFFNGLYLGLAVTLGLGAGL